VVVVDDGSTDAATLNALDQLPAGMRLVRQPNQGLPAARNTGFKAARSELVLPLDCDDGLDAAFLDVAVATLRTAPDDVAFVFADMRTHGELVSVLPRRFDPFDQRFLNQLPYCLLLRRSAWAAIGGYDETMKGGYEDWEFSLRLIEHGYRGLGLGRPLFHYFVSAGGMLMSRSARMHGTLWRMIRQRHPGLYRWRSLLAAWRATPGHRIKLPVALALLACGRLLPDAAFGRLFHALLVTAHRLRAARGR
jgi:glycosyltransferase involved in cell wall biosynthesis